MAKYSIVVPVYNKEKLISRCIESVLKQTYKDWILVLIDDGSSDKTAEICAEYLKLDSRIRYFFWPNHGVVLSRQKGIEMSDSEYVIHLDADDFWNNDLLENVDRITTKYYCDVLMFGYNIIENGKCSPVIFNLPTNKVLVDKEKEEVGDIIINKYPSLWSKVIRTELIKKDTTFYTKYKDVKLSEDSLQLYIPILKAKSIFISDNICYNYNIIQGSMSHDFKIKDIFDIMTVMEMYLETYIDYQDGDLPNIYYKTFFYKIGCRLRELFSQKEPFIDIKHKSNDIREHSAYSNPLIVQQEKIKNMDIITFIYVKLLRKHLDIVIYLIERVKNFLIKRICLYRE